MQQNKIKQIEKLDKLKNLKKLYIGYNEIACLENLENVPNLEELHVERQRLEENQIFSFDIKTLEKLSVLFMIKINFFNVNFLLLIIDKA